MSILLYQRVINKHEDVINDTKTQTLGNLGPASLKIQSSQFFFDADNYNYPELLIDDTRNMRVHKVTCVNGVKNISSFFFHNNISIEKSILAINTIFSYT